MERKYSGCEVAEIGIQIEKNGRDFYQALAENTENEEAKEAFTKLASEEERHIAVFRSIESSQCDFDSMDMYPDEYFAQLNALASDHIFTEEGKGTAIAKNISSYTEGIDLAIQFEKESISLFESMKKVVPDKEKDMVQKLIEEEESHLKILIDLRGEKGGHEKC